jgi:hypothetical protein
LAYFVTRRSACRILVWMVFMIFPAAGLCPSRCRPQNRVTMSMQPQPWPEVPADTARGQCCIGRSVRMTERHGRDGRLSDGHRELVECRGEPVAGGEVGGEFIVTTPQVLHERVTGGHDPRGPVPFQAAHRPQPRFQPAVICFDRVVRVPLDGMQCRGDQLIKDSRIGRGPVGGDLGRDRARAQRPREEPPRCRQVTALGQQDVDDLAMLVNSPVKIGPPER